VGVLRGIEVDKDWKGGEFAFDFQADLKVSLNYDGRMATGVLACPNNNFISIDWKTGFLTGITWSGLYQSWQQGPVTAEFALAFSANSSITAPISVEQAMLGNGYYVFSLSKCLKGTACAYSNPSTLAIEAAVQESTSAAARRSLRSGLADPCNAYSTCSECLAAPSKLCGWCDTPVNYTDGAPGFNCAGFDQEGKSNPSWICHVQYRRDSCFDYGCSYANESAPVCYPLPEGQQGMTKEECLLGCKPSQGLYYCNNQTFQCEHCNVKYCNTNLDCPGSYCQIDNSKPGPYICHGGIPDGCNTQQKCSGDCMPPDWGYTWRGNQIDTGYVSGEYDFTIYAAQQEVAWRSPSMKTTVANIHLGKASDVTEGTPIVLTITKTAWQWIFSGHYILWFVRDLGERQEQEFEIPLHWLRHHSAGHI